MKTDLVAVAVWDGRISPLFDVARRVLLLTVIGEAVVERCEMELPDDPAEARVAWLVRHGASTLLCGAISRPLAQRAAAVGLEVVPFLSGAVGDVLCAYLKRRLPNERFAMPGCRCRRRGRQRQGRTN